MILAVVEFTLLLLQFSMFSSLLSSCFPASQMSIVSSDPETCNFCQVTTDSRFKLIYEDSTFIAFYDRKPASRYHLLVTPKSHILSVRQLEKHDVALVQSMQEIGHRILDDLNVPPPMRKMGFHIPPFNSVDHLHLHVQGLPHLSLRGRIKFLVVKPPFGPWDKGFSGFVEVGQAIRILNKGRHIGFFPS